HRRAAVDPKRGALPASPVEPTEAQGEDVDGAAGAMGAIGGASAGDPTTLELLTLMIEKVQHLPVLLLITARPEFKQSWPAYEHVTDITLRRMGRGEGASLIGQVTGGKSLPKVVVDRIVDRTDGIPLFIEELTKTVIESGMLTDAGDRYTLAGPL